MKFNHFDAPHIRHHESTRTLMLNMVVAMLFIYGLAYFYYGPRVIALGLCSIFTALITDVLCVLIARRRPNPRDYSAVVTGMLLPLLMPASINYYIVVIAAVFAIVVAKHPFGGVGHNVFNPAAAGFSFAAICFPDKLFLYPQPMHWLPLGSTADVLTVNGPAFTLSLGGLPQYRLLDMLLGNFPGPMGATNILVIAACLAYLSLRNTVRWEIPVFFLATAAVLALLFPRGGLELGLDLAMRARLTAYELMSGMLLFGSIFLMGDPVTTPKRDIAKMAFAATAGIVVMLFRRFGGFEDSFTFALLAMNAAVWGFDMLGERFARARRSKPDPQQTAKEQIPS